MPLQHHITSFEVQKVVLLHVISYITLCYTVCYSVVDYSLPLYYIVVEYNMYYIVLCTPPYHIYIYIYIYIYTYTYHISHILCFVIVYVKYDMIHVLSDLLGYILVLSYILPYYYYCYIVTC